MRKQRCFLRLASGACLAAVSLPSAFGQIILEEVVVSANRQEQQAFDTPAAINSVGADTLSIAGPQVNLSEALSRIPGVAAANRNNYAQDPQISIRGFGARAPFGVRGIKLITDGIPASSPDGQGQASTFALTSTDRIEVLRGPLAVLYGNASGGVIQAFTRKASETPEFSVMGYAGSYGLRRGDAQFSNTTGKAGLVADYSWFETDGYRANSAAKRTQFNGKYDLQQTEKTQLSLIVNIWDQPLAQDPGGLNAARLASNRKQAGFNTAERRVRKITSQEQLGATLRHEDSARRTWEGRVYGGQRENLQYQALGTTGQWVGLDRDYVGLGLTASGPFEIGNTPLRLTTGLEADFSKERRQGGTAIVGEKTTTTRNEDNSAEAVNAFVVGTFFVSEHYTVTAGARLGNITFKSKDFVVTANDPDGSGKVSYSQFSPVVGVTRHVGPTMNVFANYGRGFETPTLAEVSYASSASGTVPTSSFNTAIRGSKNDQAELGVKWRPDLSQSLSATVFWVASSDEIVTDQSASGRTSFKNAPKTKRSGAEVSWVKSWAPQWRSVLAATLIDATYNTAFLSGTTAVAAGNKIPGIPEHVLFGELEWAQARNTRSVPLGWSAGAELQSVGQRFANDLNTLRADSFESVAIRSGYSQSYGKTDVQVFARVDNVFSEKYVGSVIVNNVSPFEPSPERNWTVGVKATAGF